MRAVRRLSIAALVVASLHLVFGAIVRISGSGMGCGDHWPKCYGYWFPPFSRPDLIVEVSHRYLASILTLTVASLLASLSTVTFSDTAPEAGLTSGVVTNVPHWPTWTGLFLVSQTLR